ncbi:MAG: ABC transporter ATP-binding protein [Phycisphaerales bacterium]
MSEPLLTVRDLTVTFSPRNGGTERFRAVDRASFTIYPRQTLAIVGESGSGKSVSAMSLLGLVPSPPSRRESGSAVFAARQGPTDLFSLHDSGLRRIRGAEIAMIFQEPMSSLNPVFTVGEQIIEAVRLHQPAGAREARRIAIEAMASVGIREPESRLSQYPHHFSGGMRQRVMIAMALACHPALLIADEPTTALDVTIQAQILELLRGLKQSRNMGVLLITHDMGVVAENADVVCVMYAGRIVEYANVFELFDRPLHPYTRGLLASIPRLGSPRERLTTVRDVIESSDAFAPVPVEIDAAARPVTPWFPGAAAYALTEVRAGHWMGARERQDTSRPPALDFRREPAA